MKKIYLVLAFCQSLLISSLAFALDLDTAKSQGFIGEKLDGYLGMVSNKTNPSIKALVQEINTKRRLKYQEIAKKNGTSLNKVEVLAGKKTIQKTQSGHFYQNSNSKWIKKP